MISVNFPYTLRILYLILFRFGRSFFVIAFAGLAGRARAGRPGWFAAGARCAKLKKNAPRGRCMLEKESLDEFEHQKSIPCKKSNDELVSSTNAVVAWTD